MKKLLFILLSFYCVQAFASKAEVKITINAGFKDVHVNGMSSNFVIENNGSDFYIKQVVVKTNHLEVKPSLAAETMKKEKCLDIKHFPEIYVEDMFCEPAAKACNFKLSIKNQERAIDGKLSKDKVTGNSQVKFNIKLSDYAISRKFGFWSVDDVAEVVVDIIK